MATGGCTPQKWFGTKPSDVGEGVRHLPSEGSGCSERRRLARECMFGGPTGASAHHYHPPPCTPHAVPASPRTPPAPTAVRCVQLRPRARLWSGLGSLQWLELPSGSFRAPLDGCGSACVAAERWSSAPGPALRWGWRMRCDWARLGAMRSNAALSSAAITQFVDKTQVLTTFKEYKHRNSCKWPQIGTYRPHTTQARGARPVAPISELRSDA